MNYLDFILACVVFGFILNGFWFGLIHMVGSLLGLIIGSIVTGRTYEAVALWLAPYITNPNTAKFVAFIGVFIIVTRLVGLAVWLFEKSLMVFNIIPFFKAIERLLGAFFGLVEGTFVAALGIYFLARFPFSSVFADTMTSSLLARKFYAVGEALAVLLPGALKAVQSIF